MAANPHTEVTYANVTLQNCLTEMFDDSLVYDDSDTDVLYRRIRVRVLGYLHKQVIKPDKTEPLTVGVHFDDESSGADEVGCANQYSDYLQRKMLTSRQVFEMTLDGKALLKVTPEEDMNNGPKPRHFRIRRIVGNEMMHVEFEIELCVRPCELPEGEQAPKVLNNRWEMVDDFDENWHCTRTITGRLRIAPEFDRLETKHHPQLFRHMVMPPLQSGFKVKAMKFATSKDGLSLDYSIAHQTVHAAAPYPATSWRGTHTLSTGDGVNTFGEVAITVQGRPGGDKKVLVQLAQQIAQTKLGVSRAGNDPNYHLEQAAIVDHLESNAVDLRMRIRHKPQQALTNFFSNDASQIGSPLELESYDHLTSRSPKLDELPPLAKAFVCQWQSPCLPDSSKKVPGGTLPASDQNDDGEDTDIYHRGEDGDLPDLPELSDEPRYSEEHQVAIYLYYRVTSRYETNHRKIQLPIAGSVSPGQPTSKTISLGGATARRIIKIDAERARIWPRIPAVEDYEDPTGKAVLTDSSIDMEEVRLGADGVTPIHSIQATLTYALERPPKPGEYGTVELPWIEGSTPEAMPEGQFDLGVAAGAAAGAARG